MTFFSVGEFNNNNNNKKQTETEEYVQAKTKCSVQHSVF